MFGRSTTALPAVPGLQAQVSRRAMLGGLASLAVLVATPSLAFADTPSPKASPFGTPRRNQTPFRDADGNLIQPGPYTVQASCDLTEDYFLTADVLVGADDQVVPFVNHLNGGAVEAVVVSQESKTLSHVRRDPTTLSGWTISAIQFPAQLGSVAQVAVAASPKGVFIGTVAPPDPQTNNSTLSWFSWLTDATTWATGSVMGPGAPLEMLRSGVAPDQTPYFYGWVGSPTKVGKVPSLTFTFLAYLCLGQAAPQIRSVLELTYPAASQPNIPDAVLMYDVTDTGDAVHGVAAVSAVTYGQNSMTIYPQSGTSFSTAGKLWEYDDATALLWATTSAPGQWAAVVSRPAGDIVYADQNTPGTNLYGFGSDLNYGDVAAWVNDGVYTFNVLADGVVSVMSQATADGPFGLPVPLVNGVDRIYTAITDPEQSTLFTVMADTTLSVLTKDPTTGWTQHQVHQATAQMQEVESYRTVISLLDTNEAGVSFGQATISTDRLVGMWQEPGSNTIIEPGTPVTMTADYEGKITVSIPAEELDCATLTVQPLDSTGKVSGTAFTVTPHTDVATFLAGQGSLLDAGQLTGPTLQGAKTESGASLFPNLGGASGATAAAAAIAHMGSLGSTKNQPSDLAGVQSAMFDMTASIPAFQSSTNPNAFSIDTVALNAKRRRDAARLAKHHRKHHRHPIGNVGGISDWWNSVKHDGRSAFHGLRHGAIKFKKMVTTWASDAKQWTVNLIVDIGDGLDSLMTYVIDGVESAIHAIGSFFHALGADIKAAVDWLKNHILAYLAEAEANATIIQGWFTTAIGTTATPGPFYTVLATAKGSADGYFDNLTDKANTAFGVIEAHFGTQTFGVQAKLPEQVAYTGAMTALDGTMKDIGKIGEILKYSPTTWLWDKIKKHLDPNDAGPAPIAAFGPVLDDLATDFQDVMTLANSILTLIQTTAQEMFGTKTKYGQATIADWFKAVNNTVDDGVAVLKAIADTLFDMLQAAFDSLLGVLNYQTRILPTDTLLGQIFKKAGLDPSLSVGHLISLIAAFPATLISSAMGNGPLFPAQQSIHAHQARTGRRHNTGRRHTKGGPRVGDSNGGWETGLGLTAAVVQGIWGFNDIIVDLQTGKEEDGTEREAPSICGWVDVIAPVLLTILQWPSEPLPNGQTAPPFTGGILHDTPFEVGMLSAIILTGLVPSATGLFGLLRTPLSQGSHRYVQEFLLAADPNAEWLFQRRAQHRLQREDKSR